MKKLFFAVFISAAIPVVGQENKFDVGLTGGPSIIFLRGNDIIKEGHQPTLGFAGGLFFQYHFSKLFSLLSDVKFERKGSAVLPYSYYDIVLNTTQKKDIHVNFNYLTTPLLCRMTFGKKNPKLFVNAGPYGGYLIKQTFVYPKGTILPDKKVRDDNTYNDKRIDLGAAAGFGFIIRVGEIFLISLELRDSFGLYNVSKVPVYNDGTIKTNSANFLLGFTWQP